jgi:hypothetical protein
MQHRIDSVPLFGQNDGPPAALQVRQQNLVKQTRRQRGGVVRALTLFTVIDTGGMMMTDPLAPTMPPKPSLLFMTGKLGIADKPEMSLEACVGEGFAQSRDAPGNASGSGIAVRPFKAEDVKLRVDWRSLNCGRARSFHTPFPLIAYHTKAS